ncbi:hypothetical protein FACS1894132_14910 [Clostridia bacterium]|nr:hypothetical protein FACS1894132_14910 [Clostridia bacterium]
MQRLKVAEVIIAAQNKKGKNMSDKRIRSIVVVLLTALTISAVIIIFTFIFAKNDKAVGNDQVADAVVISEVYETNLTTVVTKPIGYVMREYEGVVAVFREGSDLPYQVLDYPMYLLSDDDKIAIEKGIYVETEAEIRRLIEDICS